MSIHYPLCVAGCGSEKGVAARTKKARKAVREKGTEDKRWWLFEVTTFQHAI